MDHKIRAVYRSGTFVLQEPYDVPEEAEVELIVRGPITLAPKLTDPTERARRLRIVTERMRGNPIPLETARLSREDLHERR